MRNPFDNMSAGELEAWAARQWQSSPSDASLFVKGLIQARRSGDLLLEVTTKDMLASLGFNLKFGNELTFQAGQKGGDAGE